MNPTFKSLHQAHAAALDAYEREDLWPDGVREALRALLGFLGAEPEQTHTYLVELRYVPGGRPAPRRRARGVHVLPHSRPRR
jgi:hypothetical protein